MDNRPTLAEQIAVSKMTNDECVKALVPHGFPDGLWFWLYCRNEIVWRILTGHWFDLYTGKISIRACWKSYLKGKQIRKRMEQGLSYEEAANG